MTSRCAVINALGEHSTKQLKLVTKRSSVA